MAQSEMDARQGALALVSGVLDRGRSLAEQGDAPLRDLPGPERARAQALALATLRHLGRIDALLAQLGDDLGEVGRSDNAAGQDVDYPIRTGFIVQKAEQGGGVEYDLATHAPPRAGALRSARQPSRRLRAHTCAGSREHAQVP